MIVFACISPHPPLLLPDVGSAEDQRKVTATQQALLTLGKKLAAAKPDYLVVSSPHPEWGINVPLHFLTARLTPKTYRIQSIITGLGPPEKSFKKGKKIAVSFQPSQRIAWIASGDLSHRLHKDGPYGFHPQGPKFDQTLMELLSKKDVHSLLSLNPEFIECAGECGLRSIVMCLGALEETKTDWEARILSYEAPFGVGYLVAKLK